MSSGKRKRKAFEEKIRNFLLVLAGITASIFAVYSAATGEFSGVIAFLFDAIAWVVAAVVVLHAVVLVTTGVKRESPRTLSFAWAIVLIGLPFLIAHALRGETKATQVQLYLLGNLCALFLLSIFTTLGVLSPE